MLDRAMKIKIPDSETKNYQQWLESNKTIYYEFLINEISQGKV
jgi:hypothetical protein